MDSSFTHGGHGAVAAYDYREPGLVPQTSATRLRLSVILPAFDEEQRIATTLRDLRGSLDATVGEAYELIVIDDGSNDRTLEAAFDAADECPRCTVVSYAANAGKGSALQRGLASARGELVAFFDADGDISGETLLELLRSMSDAPGVSVVVGRRRWTVPRPWHRRLASGMLSRFARLALDVPVHETQAGVKVFVRSDVMRVLPECHERGYLFDLEVLARMHRWNFRMASVDILQSRERPSRIGIGEGVREVLPAFRIWRTLRREASMMQTPAPSRPQPLPVRTAGDDTP